MSQPSMNRRKFACTAVALGVVGIAPTSHAQGAGAYPTKPIQFIVGFPAGGVADTVSRIVATALSQRLGQPVIVDNRSGAGGVIGADLIAKSAPDGYTMGLGVSGALTSSVTLNPKLPYDPLKDFALITKLINSPLALVVTPSLKVNTLKEFIALAKTKPGKLAFGTPGNGSAMHLAGELLNELAGIELQHIPYKGSAPVTTDLIGGHIEVAILELSLAKPLMDSGKLKALAVTSSKRATALPDLPTMAEAGVPGYEMLSWLGLLMPAKTPPDILKRISTEVGALLNDPKVREQIAAAKAEPAPGTSEELMETIRKGIQTNGALIKKAGIKPD